MNCDSVQFWPSIASSTHSFSVHFAKGDPDRSTASPKNFTSSRFISLRANASWSTGVDQSRSVVTFHCDVFAFS